jgi:hypothetical protein
MTPLFTVILATGLKFSFFSASGMTAWAALQPLDVLAGCAVKRRKAAIKFRWPIKNSYVVRRRLLAAGQKLK